MDVAERTFDGERDREGELERSDGVCLKEDMGMWDGGGDMGMWDGVGEGEV